MARRSSARLANRYSTTPKRVSLSHDAPIKTPRTAPVKLSSLDENDEMPGAFPQSASPPERATPSARPGVKIPVRFDDSTPKRDLSVKPASDEMHPAQHHQSTAGPLDEARWLGFANMAPHTEPPKPSSKIATLQSTPTRVPKAQTDVTAPQYQFTFQREHSLELSPDAKKLMFEKREEALRIREQMTAAGEGQESVEAAVARKIAMPKGKNGRYSGAHLQQFQKMESIASHPSAFRADPKWKQQHESAEDKMAQPASKNLKRSPSKAQLDEPTRLPAPGLGRNCSKLTPSKAGGTLPRLPRSTSIQDFGSNRGAQSPSPAKRIKRFEGDDATITRPSSSGSEARQPGTPSPVKCQPTYPDLSTLASPTQSSLARAASVKTSSKIPAPALLRSPSKVNLADHQQGSPKPSTPLLARSPSKSVLFADVKKVAATDDAQATTSQLLARSPSKASLFRRQDEGNDRCEQKPKESPYLSRTPMKMSVSKGTETAGAATDNNKGPSKAPLLCRSPLKMSVAKSADLAGETGETAQKTNQAALLSRSPMKMSINKPANQSDEQQQQQQQQPTKPVALLARSPERVKVLQQSTETESNTIDNTSAETPTKLPTKGLMGRFNKLRATPLKSILRSPQRLYSDDPAKVASGTHLATPPKKSAAIMNRDLIAAAKTMPAQKRVDFTTSTNARYERAQSELVSTPSKTPAPAAEEAVQAPPKPMFAQYPSLPDQNSGPAMTPQKRRQTIAPGDFTFRAGPDGIIFGTSPNAPATASANKRPATIRHVSAEPQLQGSTMKKRKVEFENEKATRPESPIFEMSTTAKKRKFEFENDKAADGDAVGSASDKENAGEEVEERPTKRVKQSAPSPEKKTIAKRPTLGVRPKDAVKGAKGANAAKEKKPTTTITQSRLAALAQPKKRG